MFLSLRKCAHPMSGVIGVLGNTSQSRSGSKLYDVLICGVTWCILFSIFTKSAQIVAIGL